MRPATVSDFLVHPLFLCRPATSLLTLLRQPLPLLVRQYGALIVRVPSASPSPSGRTARAVGANGARQCLAFPNERQDSTLPNKDVHPTDSRPPRPAHLLDGRRFAPDHNFPLQESVVDTPNATNTIDYAIILTLILIVSTCLCLIFVNTRRRPAPDFNRLGIPARQRMALTRGTGAWAEEETAEPSPD